MNLPRLLCIIIILIIIADQWKGLTNEWLRWCWSPWNERLIASLGKVSQILFPFPPLSFLCVCLSVCLCVCVCTKFFFFFFCIGWNLKWNRQLQQPRVSPEAEKPLYHQCIKTVANKHTRQWNITCCTVWCNSQAMLSFWQSVLEVFKFTWFLRSDCCTALHDHISRYFTLYSQLACWPIPCAGDVFFWNWDFSPLLQQSLLSQIKKVVEIIEDIRLCIHSLKPTQTIPPRLTRFQ